MTNSATLLLNFSSIVLEGFLNAILALDASQPEYVTGGHGLANPFRKGHHWLSWAS